MNWVVYYEGGLGCGNGEIFSATTYNDMWTVRPTVGDLDNAVRFLDLITGGGRDMSLDRSRWLVPRAIHLRERS